MFLKFLYRNVFTILNKILLIKCLPRMRLTNITGIAKAIHEAKVSPEKISGYRNILNKILKKCVFSFVLSVYSICM